MAIASPKVEPLPFIIRDLADGVLRLTLNRPEKRNALSEGMLAALQETFDEAAADKAVRVVVIAGSGPAFSGGHDLKEMTARRADEDKGRAYFHWLMQTCSKMMQTVVNCPKPVIAEVNGLATAAGCQLVASCDLAIASETSRFGVSGINFGLFCSTPMVALSRNVARKHAMEMLLTGEFITAEHAQRIGLINRAVPGDELRAAVDALAGRIAGQSMATVKIGKQAFYRQVEMELADAYEYCADIMVENMLFRDAENGIGAFIAKTKPEWEDR